MGENSKPICMSGALFLTQMGRIVLDDHECETYLSGDKILMTKNELTQGIPLTVFIRRLRLAREG